MDDLWINSITDFDDDAISEWVQKKENSTENDIAIIGMACRFPGANSPSEFWSNLKNGVESITHFSKEELIEAGIDQDIVEQSDYIRARAIIDNVDLFDAPFFGYAAREAKQLDPQHRLFLECSQEALERAGYGEETYRGKVGVFGGMLVDSYSNEKHNPAYGSVEESAYIAPNGKDFLTTLVSYKLNLDGPSVNVQTACSSSLVSVHLASQSLLNDECSLALAGGVSIHFPQKTGYLNQAGDIFSSDGHCRAFDAKATGTVFGNGLGIVVLKRLKDALHDGDTIQAVIKGSAVNNDGSLKVGFAAPSVDGQAQVITDALNVSGINPETINYIEAHGTGTALGDPIEIAALTQAFKKHTNTNQFCHIGSVKTNIGHLNAAAGVASLIKTVLALQHQQIPPSLHFNEANPEIDFSTTPFIVNADLQTWESNHSTPRRAAVTSLGVGGTNAHIIVEEAPLVTSAEITRPWQLLTISAKTPAALDQMTENLKLYLAEKDIPLADVAYTLQLGREAFNQRRILVCDTHHEAVLQLSQPEQISTKHQVSGERPIVFMFSGQGSQYIGMGADLYETETTFRETIDYCADYLYPLLGIDLRLLMFTDVNDNASTLQETRFTQSALFIVEYALSRLWMEWGVQPEAMIGHSIGEYVAACLAGVFSLDDVLELVALRGQLMQSLPAGKMLSVMLPADEVRSWLTDDICLATINAPSLCVVSGTDKAIDDLAVKLNKNNIQHRVLHTSHAFHSFMMQPMIEEFVTKVNTLTLNTPVLPFISNVTGDWIKAEDATSGSYWGKHLLQTVLFSNGLQTILKELQPILLEIGPGNSLVTFAKQHLTATDDIVTLTSLHHPKKPQHDVAFLLKNLGEAWLAGLTINWQVVYQNEQRQRIPLPTYPFDYESYWIEPNSEAGNPLLDNKRLSNPADWFYIPVWKQAPLPSASLSDEISTYLLFVDDDNDNDNDESIGLALHKRLESETKIVIQVHRGEKYKQVNKFKYVINQQKPEDYSLLIDDLNQNKLQAQCIIHTWNTRQIQQEFEQIQEQGFYSLLYLTQALAEQGWTSLQLITIASQLYSVTGNTKLIPEKTTLLGAMAVIPLEFPNIHCRSIDVQKPYNEQVTNQLIQELQLTRCNGNIAYRGKQRWTQTFDPIHLLNTRHALRLRSQGTYLITGGLGGIGLVFARYLAEQKKAIHLILIARSSLPERHTWNTWLDEHPAEDATSKKIQAIKALEILGATVEVISADVTNAEQMQHALKPFEVISGVIHAAGIAGGGIIQRKNKESADEVMAAKVKGTLVLEQLLKEYSLDFWVLCSSLSVLGDFGQVDYCAANAFLDSFAHQQQLEGRPVVSINWATWKEVGMAVDNDLPADLQSAREEELRKGLTNQEGMDAFQRIVNQSFAQVLVSPHPLTAYLDDVKEFSELAQQNLSTSVVTNSEKYQRPALNTDYIPPSDDLEKLLAESWQDFFALERIGIQDDFFELGGHSLSAMQLINALQSQLGEILHVTALFDAPNIEALAVYLRKNYSDAIDKMLGIEAETNVDINNGVIDSTKVSLARQKIPSLPTLKYPSKKKNPQAIFILSPSRSGSTLLRVMLAGHPALFAPPELNLLQYNSLGQRKDSKDLLNEGVIRTLMQLHSIGNIEAQTMMEEFESLDMSIQDFYADLQTTLKGKILVEKTPNYALSLDVLQRAEQYFDNPLYIHLTRHPLATIRSFEEVKLDLLGGPFSDHKLFTRREIAELDWLVSQQNILEFLSYIPSHRQHRLSFESLVSEPEDSTKNLCKFLGLDFHANMLQPYQNKTQRMTDGIHSESRQIGDVKFHQYETINPETANRWQQEKTTDFLSEVSWKVAAQLDYSQPIETTKTFPLALGQKRLWFIEQLEGANPAYNLTKAVRLKGKLDIPALERSLQVILRRHEILQATFGEVNGEPIQHIEIQKLTLKLIDVEEHQIKALVREETLRPFDLGKDLMLRAQLLCVEEDDHVLQTTMHHIASDAWSRTVFNTELVSLYSAFVQELPSTLAPLPMQYTDFIRWQQGWLNEARIEEQLTYWKQQLAGELPTLSLPQDYSRPETPSFAGQQCSRWLSSKLNNAVKQLSQQQHVTPFMVMLTTFNILVARLSGLEDIILGTPVTRRNSAELENMIGFFINTVVLRTDVSGSPSFIELLTRTKQVTSDAYANQDVPFEKVVEAIRPERAAHRNPFFQIWFNMFPGREDLHLPGLESQEIDGGVAPSMFDLIIYIEDFETDIKLSTVYNGQLFKAERMEFMLEQFQYLLEQVLEQPTLPVNQYSLRSEKLDNYLPNPKQILTATWANAAHEVFSQQAQKTPNNLALIGHDVKISYQELEEISNQLAHYLGEQGIGKNDVVAIYADRNPQLVIAMLATLKVGAAFMILDASYPEARLLSYCGQAKPCYLLHQETAGRVPDGLLDFVSTRHWRLSGDFVELQHSLCNYLTENLNVSVTAQQWMYISFTSGSTGKPKAVIGSHQPVAHFINWHIQTFGFTKNDRFSLLSGLAHDPLLRDIFTPLSIGAVLCIPTQEVIAPRLLSEWFSEHDITVAHLTPQMGQVLTIDQKTINQKLSYLFFGGDQLNTYSLKTIRTYAPHAHCVNFYGTTETPQVMAYANLPLENEHELIPLGKGIEGVQLLIINQHGKLAGIGELGEIVVRTPYLSQGYLGDDLLTQQSFIQNLWTSDENDYMYKTGDLGRYLPNGEVIFSHRKDGQLKIRGFRIETGEIETLLVGHPDIQAALVTTVDDIDITGNKQLVAYIVPQSSKVQIDNASIWLRPYLEKELPHHMLPSAFVPLEAIPLTPTGKIDFHALPTPNKLINNEHLDLILPRNQIEMQLLLIWKTILNQRSIDVTSHFFDLGGHSLLAMQLITKVNKKFKQTLSLAQFFQQPTIEQMAKNLEQENPSDYSPLIGIQTNGNRPPLFCIHGADGYVHRFYPLANALGENQPFYALQAVSFDNEISSPISIEAMAKRYIETIRSVQPQGPYHLSGYSFGAKVAYEVAFQLQELGEEVALLAIIDGAAPNANDETVMDDAELLICVLKQTAIWYEKDVKLTHQHLNQLTHEEQSKAIHQEMEQWNIPNADENSQFFMRNFQTYKQHIYLPYEIEKNIDVPCVFFHTKERVERTKPTISQSDPTLGWGQWIDKITCRSVSGNHVSLLASPYVEKLAIKLKPFLTH